MQREFVILLRIIICGLSCSSLDLRQLISPDLMLVTILASLVKMAIFP